MKTILRLALASALLAAPSAPALAEDGDPAPIAWRTDLDAAKQEAKEAVRPLVLYATPSWFECMFCRQLENAALTDDDVRRYFADHVVAVKAVDAQDATTAKRFGVRERAYPDVYVMSADGELVGRVIGFPGVDAWTEQLEDAVGRAERLPEARRKTAEDPLAWGDVAMILKDAPGREADAAAAFANLPAEGVPLAVRAARARFEAEQEWRSTLEAVGSTLKEKMAEVDPADLKTFATRQAEAAREAAGEVVEKLDAWIKEHGEEAKDILPTAVRLKFDQLLRGERWQEAVAVGRDFIEKFPEHPMVGRIRSAVEGALRKAEELVEEAKKKAGDTVR